MEREYWLEYTNKDKEKVRDPIEEAMVAKLLDEEILYINDWGNHTSLYVNCNDVFVWACADGEPLSILDIPVLFEEYEKDPRWGSTKWVCKKRNEKPQVPIEKMMKDEGLWTEEMEALPDNLYWKKLNEENE